MSRPRNYTERLRRAEFDLVRGEFSVNDRVLEIGGGSGFLQTCIAECVGECVSIDVAAHPNSVGRVTLYDGRKLPFGDAVFDIIFSSNVLEHVDDLDGMLAECGRVLKPGGRMIHVVPTPWWRIWTLLTYYPALPVVLKSNLRNLISESAPAPVSAAQPQAAPVEQPRGVARLFRRFKLKWLRTILISPRHGERGNEITEIFYFRAAWWRTLFEKNGWVVDNVRPCGLFYSGNILLGDILDIRARRRLSKLLGNSTRVFSLSQRER